MALKKKKNEGGDAPVEAKGKKEKGGKGNLVPALVVAVGLVLGGKMMGGGASEPAAAGETEVSTTSTTVLGPVVALEPTTLNLADDRYLKVALALQLSAEAGEGGGHGGGEENTTAVYAREINTAHHVLSGKTSGDLRGAEGREHARQEIAAELTRETEGDIVDVYFTEFVRQ
jgi:flagellar FliL protein